MKKPAVLLLMQLCIIIANGQSVTGSWYGRADPVTNGGYTNNYLTELIIKQKGDEVEGVFGYYFKNMYKSIYVRGRYDKSSRQVSIKNIPVIHYRATSSDDIDCPMEFQATLVVSKLKSSLTGYFYRPDKYRYTCPDLRINYTLDNNESNQDSVLRSTIATLKMWHPLPEDVVVNNTGTTISTPALTATTTTAPPTANTTTKSDNHSNINIPIPAEETILVEKYNARKNIVQQELVVNADSVRISFYDNGDIDGDSISVFMNGKPILNKRELDVRGLNLYLKLDTTKTINEISMFAENLGKYPPNTALMIIFDGEKSHEIYLSSSLTQNASVRIRRK